MTRSFQLQLIPERTRRNLMQWEREILSDLYGGDTFAEILEQGYTTADILEVIRLAIQHGLIWRGRGPYRKRFTRQGRHVVETFRRDRDAFEAKDYRLIYTPCPVCGKPRLGLVCFDDDCWTRRQEENLPPAGAALEQRRLL